jgi:hypothetical protein
MWLTSTAVILVAVGFSASNGQSDDETPFQCFREYPDTKQNVNPLHIILTESLDDILFSPLYSPNEKILGICQIL